MTDDEVALLLQGLVRGGILTVGTVCLVLGYRLFVKDVFEDGAHGKDQQTTQGKGTVGFDKGGLGLILALFGAIVTVLGILHKPATVERTERPHPSGTAFSSASPARR